MATPSTTTPRSPDLAVRIASADDMRGLGQRIGALLRIGDVIALVGPLGAGKTTFAQGLARGLGVADDRHIASPSFALVNEHPGRVPFVHADLYRIVGPAELQELGLEEAGDRAAVAIEWADRFPEILPTDHLEIRLSPDPDGARRVAFTATGARGQALVDRLVTSSVA